MNPRDIQQNDLKRRQAASEAAERLMMDFLLQYTPCENLKINDAKAIAFRARNLVFDAMIGDIG